MAGAEAELASLREKLQFEHRMLESYERALGQEMARGERSNTVIIKPPDMAPVTGPTAGPAHRLWPTQSEPWWPAVAEPAESLDPSPGFGGAAIATEDAVVTMVIVFGLRGEALADAVATITAAQRRSQKLVPVFVTDSPDQRVFVREGYVFEYFPSPLYLGPDDRLDERRLQPRIAYLRRKWNVSATIDLSPSGGAPAGTGRNETHTHGGAPDFLASPSPASPPNAPTGLAPQPAQAAEPGPEKAGAREPGTDQSKTAGLAAIIRASGLFDEVWYSQTYPDVAASGSDPVTHYLEQGAAAGYNPHPLFDTLYYARQMLRARAQRR
jgi:hypothetical protein